MKKEGEGGSDNRGKMSKNGEKEEVIVVEEEREVRSRWKKGHGFTWVKFCWIVDVAKGYWLPVLPR